MNTFEQKNYKKVVTLSTKKANIYLSQFANDVPEVIRKQILSLLLYKGIVTVDRTRDNYVSFYSQIGVIAYPKDIDQSARQLVMCCLTARNYSHFVDNVKKKFKKMPVYRK